VSGLAVVNSPAVHCVREGFLQVQRSGPTYPDFDECAFINKELKVVPTTCLENFRADCSLESTSFLGGANKQLFIKSEFGTGFGWIPAKECCITREVRASKPSGGLIITSSSYFTAMLLLK